MIAVQSSGREIAVRLQPGDEVHTSLLRACAEHGVVAAFVISGIGMLRDPKLGYLKGVGEYHEQVFPGEHELLNLSGNVSLYNGEAMAHLHVTLSGHDFAAFGGHLFTAQAAITVEVLVLPCGEDLSLTRQLEAESGLPGLRINKRATV